jgi:hypothetical protein
MSDVYLEQRDLCDQTKWSSQRWVQHEGLRAVDLGNCKQSNVMKRDRKGLTELRACTREFLAISLSMETSTVSLAGWCWSELGRVEAEVVISRIGVRAAATLIRITCYDS